MVFKKKEYHIRYNKIREEEEIQRRQCIAFNFNLNIFESLIELKHTAWFVYNIKTLRNKVNDLAFKSECDFFF